MKFKRIFLIGFMCSGKSTVGKELAKSLSWKFCDLDEEVQKEEGMSIKEIFELKGEDYFRKRELEVLKLLVLEDNAVISTGGGLGANKEALELMKRHGLVVWLDVSFDAFLQRCKNAQERPLLKKSLEELKKLYQERKKIYSQAHAHIDTKEEPDKIAQRIIQILQDERR
ncbi:Shikimate kinase [bacterium HR13]|nr:Shikimate kinase [bacterium HR13]